MRITSDTVFFLTGGASGLGEATVRLLHGLGAKIAVADMNEENLAKLKAELKTNIITVKCDVTVEDDVKRAIDETVKAFGTIHAALACAGVATVVQTLNMKGKMLDTKTFAKTIEINLYGSIYVAKYAAVVMSKN
jgi:3-hydroxyacyl-CoA dehydrogenase/3-hydroxy-2-methylbutyryl-CoA dehydrogenase